MNSTNSSRNATPKLPSKPAKTIDLGAAANYGKTASVKSQLSSSASLPQSVASTSSLPVSSDLVDLFSGSTVPDFSSQPSQAPSASVSSTQNANFFADFSSAPPGGGSIEGSGNLNTGMRSRLHWQLMSRLEKPLLKFSGTGTFSCQTRKKETVKPVKSIV